MAVEKTLFEKRPPRIEVIKVTRDNYNEVAKELGVKRISVNQGELDVTQRINFFFDNDNEPLEFKIPADLTVPYESYIYREVNPNNPHWSNIRQYDLSFGYFEVTSTN